MNLHQKILGHPFVYDKVRPWVVGGIDMGPVYGRLEVTPDDVVLDLGCGTGVALEYLSGFAGYLGIDTDPVAIGAAEQRHRGRSNVRFLTKLCTKDDIVELSPTVVVMAGLLHHLPDDAAVELLQLAASGPRVRRIVTQDIVYLDGWEHLVSNGFAALDRGRFCRRQEGYRGLVERAGLRLVTDGLIWSHPKSRRTRYFVMTLLS
ncbi:MAG TPA: class I SAM-dependent methyltransferase [Polyangiaceae bacterium]